MVNGRNDLEEIHGEKKKKKKTGRKKVNFALFRFRFKLNKKHDQNASSPESYRLLKIVALHMLSLILFTNYILLGVEGKRNCTLKACMWVIS